MAAREVLDRAEVGRGPEVAGTEAPVATDKRGPPVPNLVLIARDRPPIRLRCARDVLHARGHRPADPPAAGGRRPDVLHRPREGHRAVHLGRPPAGQAARAARPDPGLRRHRQPRRDRAAAHRVHLDPADRPVPARRLTGHGWRRSPRSSPAGRSPATSPTSSRSGWPSPATSRTCWPGSAPPPTSRPARRSCSRPTTRTGPSPEGDGPDSVVADGLGTQPFLFIPGLSIRTPGRAASSVVIV